MSKHTVRHLSIIIVMAVLCSTYIFAVAHYDRLPSKITELKQSVILEGFELEQVEVILSGIKYDEQLTDTSLTQKGEEMVMSLAHDVNCSRLCKLVHQGLVTSDLNKNDEYLQLVATYEGDNHYEFTMKNQKDIHYNTYYKLVISGKDDLEDLDQLRMYGYDQLKRWDIAPKEYITFSGTIDHLMTEDEMIQQKDKILKQISGKETNYYEDGLEGRTVAYYGYTKLVDDYIVEADGQKSNVQITFIKDEITHQTKFIIAFPFYNEPF